MNDGFKDEFKYIDKMTQLLKLNNRDPDGKKLLKVKIDQNVCTLADRKTLKAALKGKNNRN